MAAGFVVAAIVAVVLLIPGLVIVIAAGVAAGRGDPDDSGRRGRAVYLGATSFVALFVALFASFGIVVSLTMLIGPDASGAIVPGNGSGVLHAVPLTGGGSRNNEVTSAALGAGLIGLAAGIVVFLHLPRLWSMLGDGDSRGGGAGRTLATYLNATSFLSVFVAALAGASALYGVYRTIAPGVALTSGRSDGIRQLIDSAYLAVAAGVIFVVHRRQAAGAPGPAEPGTGSLNPPSTPPD